MARNGTCYSFCGSGIWESLHWLVTVGFGWGKNQGKSWLREAPSPSSLRRLLVGPEVLLSNSLACANSLEVCLMAGFLGPPESNSRESEKGQQDGNHSFLLPHLGRDIPSLLLYSFRWKWIESTLNGRESHRNHLRSFLPCLLNIFPGKH